MISGPGAEGAGAVLNAWPRSSRSPVVTGPRELPECGWRDRPRPRSAAGGTRASPRSAVSAPRELPER
ncbi:hypothetical protein BJY16_000770 [Actinoplanes octamycinicus]|uniref:Uncharacterized protein n=1 Tax=Actinoplanes octamycinicus TaxID=135948 RepID=A0A7W7M554_9ACTN|nr:hypothetical protein [Actinoplanes octamycinicus]